MCRRGNTCFYKGLAVKRAARRFKNQGQAQEVTGGGAQGRRPLRQRALALPFLVGDGRRICEGRHVCSHRLRRPSAFNTVPGGHQPGITMPPPICVPGKAETCRGQTFSAAALTAVAPAASDAERACAGSRHSCTSTHH